MFLIGIITVVLLTLFLPTMAGLDRWKGCGAFAYRGIEAHPNRIASTALWFSTMLLTEIVSATLMVATAKAMAPRDTSLLEGIGGVMMMLFSIFFTLGVYVFLTEHAKTRKTVTL